MSTDKGSIEILKVTKRGEWYTVEGVREGRRVKADVHAYSVDQPKPNAEQVFKRALEVVDRAER